jgi:uncharacterized Zn finger protein
MVISMLEEEVRRLTELEMQADQRINKAREDDITKIQEKLDNSKKNLYGFDAKEAEWINGFEAGLDAAIDILIAQQAGEP